jgi:hypothetical protein
MTAVEQNTSVSEWVSKGREAPLRTPLILYFPTILESYNRSLAGLLRLYTDWQ